MMPRVSGFAVVEGHALDDDAVVHVRDLRVVERRTCRGVEASAAEPVNLAIGRDQRPATPQRA